MSLSSGYFKKGMTMRAVWILVLTAVLWISAPLQAAENVTYYHNDALGSPVAATDADGNLLWREIYEPFGGRFEQDPSSDGNSRWYTGHQETDYGLVYMGARHYDPVIGRFLSTDPIRFKESNRYSFNRYIYANQNPFSFFDPNGEEPIPYYESSTYGQPMQSTSGAEDAATVLTLMIPVSKARPIVRALSSGGGRSKASGHEAIPAPSSGSLRNASGNLDDAAQAARTQPQNTPVLTRHAQERMAGSRGDSKMVSSSRVEEASTKGTITSTRGPTVTRTISAAESESGRGLTVVQDVRTNNVVTVIDKGSKR